MHLDDPHRDDIVLPEDSKKLAQNYKTTPPELFNRSPLGQRSFINMTDAQEINPQDQPAAANTDSFQLKSTIVQSKQDIDNHNLFCNSFASVKPVVVQEAGQSMVTVVESEESSEHQKAKGGEQPGLATNANERAIESNEQAVSQKLMFLSDHAF